MTSSKTMIKIEIFKDYQSFYWRMKHTADKTVAFQKLWNSYLVVECISGTFSSFCLYEIFDIFFRWKAAIDQVRWNVWIKANFRPCFHWLELFLARHRGLSQLTARRWNFLSKDFIILEKHKCKTGKRSNRRLFRTIILHFFF